MSALPGAQKIRSSLEAVAQWYRDWMDRTSAADLRCLGEAEVDRMAKDVGVSADELRRLVNQGPESAELLLRRMAELDLDRSEVTRQEPETFRELQQVCSRCKSRRQCARDLASHAADPAWKDYCPNAATLEALNARPWAARREW
jgi:hypothetical protein